MHADETRSLDTIEEREQAIMLATTADFSRLQGNAPMHYWIAQRLFVAPATPVVEGG